MTLKVPPSNTNCNSYLHNHVCTSRSKQQQQQQRPRDLLPRCAENHLTAAVDDVIDDASIVKTDYDLDDDWPATVPSPPPPRDDRSSSSKQSPGRRRPPVAGPVATAAVTRSLTNAENRLRRAARRERKATKTLAIVLGEEHDFNARS